VPVTEKLMPMMQNGLAKLTEECGEVLQIAGKLVQYPHLQQPGTDELHPDGTHLRTELQNEMADVIAAFEFVAQRLQLNSDVIDGRVSRKVALFELWDRERAAQETFTAPSPRHASCALHGQRWVDGCNACAGARAEMETFPKLAPLAESRHTERPRTHAGKHIPGESYKVCWYCQL
jgi:hypothetical protein